MNDIVKKLKKKKAQIRKELFPTDKERKAALKKVRKEETKEDPIKIN